MTALVTPCGSAEPRMSRLTRMSFMPGTAKRGGATGQIQNTMFAPMVDRTRAERSRGKAAGLRRYSQARTSGVRMK